MKKKFGILFRLVTTLSLLSGCIADPGALKNPTRIVDFSKAGITGAGCSNQYLMWSSVDTCSRNMCPTKTHISNATELADVRQYIKDTIYPTTGTTPNPPNGQIPKGGLVDQALLNMVDGALGVCLDDIPPKRPTGQIYINTDFCSCLNGVSDIINDCAAACANYPHNAKPTLYLSTTVGPDIQLNPTLGNLQGWCQKLLANDKVNPQCTLSAYDGSNTISLPVIAINGSALTADLTQLSLNKTYVVKIVESTTGSNAESASFQIRRVPPPTTTIGQIGALKIAPVSQYSCLSYGFQPVPNTVPAQIIRLNYVRQLYYFPANETPPPLPPLATGTAHTLVCHDEIKYPGNDNVLYPRLELIPQHISVWDKFDQRMAPDTAGKLPINTLLQQRLLNEYNVSSTKNIFAEMTWNNRPTQGSTSSTAYILGYYMSFLPDPVTGKAICPSRLDFLTSPDPAYIILRDYIDSTEAVYIAEKEPEILDNGAGSVPQTIYGTMMINEGIVKKYGFYIENGLKIKADQNALETKTIYYYWPVTPTMDPLQQGDRKLFTIRTTDTLNGAIPPVNVARSSDKRLGCVPTTPVP